MLSVIVVDDCCIEFGYDDHKYYAPFIFSVRKVGTRFFFKITSLDRRAFDFPELDFDSISKAGVPFSSVVELTGVLARYCAASKFASVPESETVSVGPK